MYRLRELERSDLKTINMWRNDPEMIAFLGAPFRYINPDVEQRWFDNYMANRSSCVRCAITTVEDPCEILGLVSLTNIDSLNQCCSLHIMIGAKENQGKGIGSFAVNAMLDHAFRNLNLHRVELRALTTNARAIHVYEKAGFVKEGVLRKAVYKNGVFSDICQYGILKEEFLAND